MGVLAVDITEFFGMASSDMEALPKYRKQVQQKVDSGICLQCDNPANKSRGLCRHHHHRFRMDRLDTPKNKRKQFEDRMILTGKILGSQQGKRLKPAKAG